MRLATWNINSVRARLPIVDQLITTQAPDVLCLQETKVQDQLFPRDFFRERGYVHMAIRGQKGHHGVATLSRVPFEGSGHIDWCGKGDARHVSIRLSGGAAVHNFYVPAGGDEPDPAVNEKFAHKLSFLDEMIAWSKDLNDPSIMVGDLNVAPAPEDVWSHKQLLKVVSHTPVETDAMGRLQAAHGWVDAVRTHHPLPEKLYSWWSYRARDWSASDRGRRLDHVWISPALDGKTTGLTILRDARGWEKPSDHVPILVDLDV